MISVKGRSFLRHPAVVGLGAAAILAVLGLNVAAFVRGTDAPWLLGSMLVADMLVIGVGILAAAREVLVAEHRTETTTAQLESIVDSAMDAIITVDASQHIVLFNRAAELVFRYRREQAIGMPLERLLPERFRSAHRGHIEHFGRTGVTARRMGDVTTLWGLRADGEEFPLEASISQTGAGAERLYTVILRDITARLAAEDALRHSKDELQALGAAAQMTREQEKSRIARELHDELGQLLTMLQMDVVWCKEKLPYGNDALEARLARMEGLLKSTIAATRRIASDLRPLMLDDLGLVPSLEWLIENFSQRTGIACRLDIPARDLALPKAHATAIFRIVQESLTNIAKHANAQHATIAIEQDDDALVVRVEDDGVGFPTDAPRKPNSFGLFGLRERASLMGGEATIASTPGKGTKVVVRVPREAMAAA